GVTVQQITRSRDQFLDAQYRVANGVLGMNTDYSSTLQQIEGILNEPSTSGINEAMQNFFNSAQAMSQDPQNVATSQTFVQQAMDVFTHLQNTAKERVAVDQTRVGHPNFPGTLAPSQLSQTASQVNDLLAQVTNLNKSIVTVTASGAQPNDLMD